MKQTHRKTHTFDPTVIYVSDSGVTACGAHVGTEATYNPQQWEAFGAMPSVTVDGMKLECEFHGATS